MGQPIVVVEKPSSNRGLVRFETNRALTGMGHERYKSLADTEGTRPPDVLARRLFEHGGVAAIHINGNIITVDLDKGYSSDGLKAVIEDLYLFYGHQSPGAEPQHSVDSELEEGAGAAPEMTTDPGAVSAPEVSADEAPGRGGVDTDPADAAAATEQPDPPDAPEPADAAAPALEPPDHPGPLTS